MRSIHRHHHRPARAVGRRNGAAKAAAPGHDRDSCIARRVESGADRRPRKHHVDDREGTELGEILDRRISLVGTAGGIDDVDLVAEFLGGLGRPLDVAGIIGFGGADRNDADQRLVLGDGRAGGHCKARGENAA